MNKCPCGGLLFPLIAAAIAPVVYYIFTIYIATEQHIACSISQAVNIPYGSVSNISVLLFFIGALVIAIIRMFCATAFCVRTTYAVWQERNSSETNDPIE